MTLLGDLPSAVHLDPWDQTRGPCSPTGRAPRLRPGDLLLRAFLSAEPSQPGLARGRRLSAGLESLESGRWKEERPLPPSWSCAWLRREAATRAMLLVLAATSSRSRPAGELSLEATGFALRALGR